MSRHFVALIAPIGLISAALAACGAPAKVAPVEVTLADYSVTAPANIPATMAMRYGIGGVTETAKLKRYSYVKRKVLTTACTPSDQRYSMTCAPFSSDSRTV